MFLDTSIFVDFLRGNKKAKDFLDSGENFTTSIIVVMELLVGLSSKTKITSLEKFFKSVGVDVIPINNQISELAYKILRENYHASSIGIPDAFIAATALSADPVMKIKSIMTHNTKHFKGIKGLNVVKAYSSDVL